MPSIIHTDLNKLFAQMLNGVQTKPTTTYLGLRNDTPSDSDTLATVNGNEIGSTTAAGYARIAITVNSTNFVDSANGNGWQDAIAAQTFTFTGTPNPNNATSWFLTDQSTGYTGKLFASGPLNPATVTSTLQAGASSGQKVIVVTNAIAAALNANDWLYVGILGNYGQNQERGQISSIGAAGSGGTGLCNVTLVSNLSNAHVSGEPVTRDGSVRAYSSGVSEIITPTIVVASLY